MATITTRQNKDGSIGYRVQIRRKGHKPVYKTFQKKILAQRWAREQEQRIEEGSYHDIRIASKTYLKTLFERYRLDIIPARAASSKTPLESRLSTLTYYFGNMTAAAISADHILEFVDCRLEAVGSDAIRKELQLLGDVIDTAQAVWRLHIPTDPVAHAKRILTKLRKLTPGSQRERRLTPEEYAKFMDYSHTRATNIKAVVMFALATGMRRSEIAKAKREHINRTAKTLLIPETKTDWKTGGKGRTIPLFPEALQAISGLPTQLDGSLFGMEPASITRAFKRVCAECKINNLRFHDLRHEATSRLFERGYSIEEVASITGHNDWRSLKRYTHPDPERLANRSL